MRLFGCGVETSDKIRDITKTELGLTMSVGVSFNKVFAKLGSDMNATTVIIEESFKDVVSPYVYSPSVKSISDRLFRHTLG